MVDLLVAEPVLDNGVSIFKLFGRLLLNDVAAHIKDLLLGALNGHQVFNRLLTTIEKGFCRDDLSLAILHLQPAVFDPFEIFAENELHVHPQGSIEIFIAAEVDVAAEFPRDCIIFRTFDVDSIGYFGSIIEICLRFGEVHIMITGLAEMQRILPQLATLPHVILSENGSQDRVFYNLFELEAGEGVVAEITSDFFVLESCMAQGILILQFINKLSLSVFNFISGNMLEVLHRFINIF